MRVVVPNAVVDNEFPAFPKGTYEGTIAGAQVRTPQEDWVVVKLQVSDITPREGTADPGRNSFNGDITLRNTDKDGNVVDLRDAETINGNLPFSVERGAGLLAGLAHAVGVGERSEAGVAVDLAAVAEALVDGTFDGQKIAFTVDNRKAKNGKVYDSFSVIGPAA